MGRPIAIDSSIFIYVLEQNPEFSSATEALLRKVQHGDFSAVLSVIGLIEILTGPKKQGRYDLAKEYKHLIIRFPNLTVASINDNVIEAASSLRAKYRLNTPDAIHLATAIDFGADRFITNDRSLKKVKEIKIETL